MHIKLPRLSALLRNPEFSLKFRPSATNLICNIINGLNIKSIAIPAYLCQEIITSINLSTLKVIYYEIDNAYSPLLEEKHLNCDCLFICDYLSVFSYLRLFICVHLFVFIYLCLFICLLCLFISDYAFVFIGL